MTPEEISDIVNGRRKNLIGANLEGVDLMVK